MSAVGSVETIGIINRRETDLAIICIRWSGFEYLDDGQTFIKQNQLSGQKLYLLLHRDSHYKSDGTNSLSSVSFRIQQAGMGLVSIHSMNPHTALSLLSLPIRPQKYYGMQLPLNHTCVPAADPHDFQSVSAVRL